MIKSPAEKGTALYFFKVLNCGKNSVNIQKALAEIQKTTATFGQKSKLEFLLLQAMKPANEMAGAIIKSPRIFQPISQLRSFNSQRRM